MGSPEMETVVYRWGIKYQMDRWPGYIGYGDKRLDGKDRNSRVRKRPVLSQAFYAAAYTHLRHLSNQTNQRLYADSPHELAFSVSNFALTQSNFRTDQHRIFAGSETVWSWWIAWEIGFCFFLFDVILKQKHQKYFQSDMIKR